MEAIHLLSKFIISQFLYKAHVRCIPFNLLTLIGKGPSWAWIDRMLNSCSLLQEALMRCRPMATCVLSLNFWLRLPRLQWLPQASGRQNMSTLASSLGTEPHYSRAGLLGKPQFCGWNGRAPSKVENFTSIDAHTLRNNRNIKQVLLWKCSVCIPQMRVEHEKYTKLKHTVLPLTHT